MNTIASLVKRGRTFDIEDSRTTFRLQGTRQLLKALGAEPVIVHGERTYYDWASRRDVHHCALHGSGYRDCTITWPEWLTDEMIEMAAATDEAFRSARGAWHRAAARKLVLDR